VLPKRPTTTAQPGNNGHAAPRNRRLRPGVELESATLETLFREVVIGLMRVTTVNTGR
jgi:hypothetical protein